MKLIINSCLSFLITGTIWSQTQGTPTIPARYSELWRFQKAVIGKTQGNETTMGSYIMPEIIRLDDGTYRMFYTVNAPSSTAIKYADSHDGISWTVKTTVLQGAKDSTDREFIIGGASLVRLADKRYRMYYRATEKVQTGAPKYSLRSAISSDGVSFTKEPGVRIENSWYDLASPVSLAGHAGFYKLADGTFAVLFSGDPKGISGPSDVYFARSQDGLVWNYQDIRKVYDNWLDPVVVQRGTQYVLYAGLYVGTPDNSPRYGRVISQDGITWPSSVDSIAIVNNSGQALAVADIGALVKPDNTTILYTNFGSPSADIAMFTLESTTGINQNLPASTLSAVLVEPHHIRCTIHLSRTEHIRLMVHDILGRSVASLLDANRSQGIYTIDYPLYNLEQGIYIIHLLTPGTSQSKIVPILR